MKKLMIAITVLLLALFVSSCAVQQSCPAYGETQKFQRDK